MFDQLEEFLKDPEFVTKLMDYAMAPLGALGVLILGWIVSRILSSMLGRVLSKNSSIDPTLQPFLVRMLRYLVMIVTLVAALSQLGVQTASLLAVLGAAGLAIGLALQGTLSNIAAGVMLLFLRPLKNGEYIDAGGTAGTVKEIGLFATVLHTPDGVMLSVPNSSLWSSSIANYSRLPTRRIDVTVGIGYEDDIGAGLAVLDKIIAAEERILDDPAAQTMVLSLGDSSVNINLRCWVKTADYWDVLFHLTRTVKIEIEAAGLNIPFPQRTVHLDPNAAQALAAN